MDAKAAGLSANTGFHLYINSLDPISLAPIVTSYELELESGSSKRPQRFTLVCEPYLVRKTKFGHESKHSTVHQN